MKTLKIEEVYINEYETFEDALRNIWHFMENVYNQKRLYSALGCKSPIQFESPMVARVRQYLAAIK
jgi:hypothetical protein